MRPSKGAFRSNARVKASDHHRVGRAVVEAARSGVHDHGGMSRAVGSPDERPGQPDRATVGHGHAVDAGDGHAGRRRPGRMQIV